MTGAATDLGLHPKCIAGIGQQEEECLECQYFGQQRRIPPDGFGKKSRVCVNCKYFGQGLSFGYLVWGCSYGDGHPLRNVFATCGHWYKRLYANPSPWWDGEKCEHKNLP
jgi:hypothetical protein